MRVWQPGSHLTVERGQAPAAGHSWKRTRRRLAALARLAAPYKNARRARARLPAHRDARRAGASVPGEACDRRRHRKRGSHGARLDRRRVRRHRPRLPGRERRADVLQRVDGRARPRRSPQQPLPPPPAPLARLLRAQPRRRHHQPAHERHRRPRPARHGGRHLAAQEHVAAPRLDRHPLHARLAARARHADRDARAHRRDRDVPLPLHARLSRGARAPWPRDRHARRGHRRHARAPVVHTRGPGDEELPRGQRQLPPGEPPDGRPQRRLLPDRRLPLHCGHRDRARLRRLPRLRAAT